MSSTPPPAPATKTCASEVDSFAESAQTISPVVVLIIRASIAASIFWDPTRTDGMPKTPGTRAPRSATPSSVRAPVTMYSTPRSLPALTAVFGSISPESERFFSCMIAASCSRSMTRYFPDLTSSVTSMSCAASPARYQE